MEVAMPYADPTRNAAACRAWYAANKEHKKDHRNAVARIWARDNKERHNANSRAWREANKERAAAITSAWVKRNPDKANAQTNARRARLRNVGGHYTATDIQLLRQQQNDCCAAPHCGIHLAGKGTVDHIVPLVRGGSNWPENLQLLCKSCNSKKQDRTMEEWLSSL
jgi:5-methylcytosine-specific restriction endonuclease McrA